MRLSTISFSYLLGLSLRDRPAHGYGLDSAAFPVAVSTYSRSGVTSASYSRRDFGSSIILFSKRKKRRRDPPDVLNDNDLPDFVLPQEQQPLAPVEATVTVALSNSREPKPTVTSPSRGNLNAATKSVRELIGDRSLERKMVFGDETINTASAVQSLTNQDQDQNTEELPDLIQLAAAARQQQQQQQQRTELSPKRAEQAARKAEKQAAALKSASLKGEDEGGSVLSKIPFINDEKGNLQPVKVLEAGTWLGIGLLLLWEVYINTPLFDRAAPMAPVVY